MNDLHADTHPAIEEVEPKVTEHQPDVLVRHSPRQSSLQMFPN